MKRIFCRKSRGEATRIFHSRDEQLERLDLLTHILLAFFNARFCDVTAVTEAMGLIASLNKVVVMGQSIQQGSRFLGITEHTEPLTEVQIRCNHHAAVFVEFG